MFLESEHATIPVSERKAWFQSHGRLMGFHWREKKGKLRVRAVLHSCGLINFGYGVFAHATGVI